MNGIAQQQWIGKVLFTVFIVIFALTCSVTIWYVIVYLQQVLVAQQDIALPDVLKGMISATIIEVAIGIFALYKNIFNITWGSNIEQKDIAAANNRLSNSTDETNPDILIGRESYMTNICNEIDKARQEIFFTSRTMAHSEQDKAQSLIVDASVRSNTAGNIVHRGIVCANPETIRGAIDLKNKAPHIEVRFNDQHLELMDMSYFIVDRKRLILGVGRETTKQSYSLESAALSHMLRNHFSDLWERSTPMRVYLEKTYNDACLEAGENAALEIIGFRTVREMNDWINSTLSDEESVSLEYEDIYSPPKWTVRRAEFVAIIDIVLQDIKEKILNNDDISNYRQLIHSPTHIDYDKYAPAFLYLYFVANYHKVRFSLERGLRGRSICENLHILDIGCGSGASTLALVDWFSDLKVTPGLLVIDAVDHSRKQLELHEAILPGNKLSASVKINRICCDGLEYVANCSVDYDLVVDGNFFCELESNKRRIFTEHLPPRMKPDALLLVVERTKSGVFEDLKAAEYFYEIAGESLGPYDIPEATKLSMPELNFPSKSTYTVGYGLYGTEQ